MKNQYRVTKTLGMGWEYNVQIRRWWLPIWMTLSGGFVKKETAEEVARLHANPVVADLGRL